MSITIYGCVNSSGDIIFENLEICLNQSACIVNSDDHKGQIALTISGAVDETCNDIYYGCVNPTTGKFQVIIPEDCCVSECSYCYGYPTPYQVYVNFSGVTYCGPCFPWQDNSRVMVTPLFDINRTWRLIQSPDNFCRWETIIPSAILFEFWNSTECIGEPDDSTTYDVLIRYVWTTIPVFPPITKRVLLVRLQDTGYPGISIFNKTIDTVDSGCLNKSNIENSLTDCDYDLDFRRIAYGGIADATEACSLSIPLYNPLIAYFEGEISRYLGCCYECILSHGPPPDDHLPTDETYWHRLDCI